MDGERDGWVDGWMNDGEKVGGIDGEKGMYDGDRWVGGWMDGWREMGGWVDGWMNNRGKSGWDGWRERDV